VAENFREEQLRSFRVWSAEDDAMRNFRGESHPISTSAREAFASAVTVIQT
jgi:hypothetical protein